VASVRSRLGRLVLPAAWSRIIEKGDPTVVRCLLEVVDLSTPWSGNYTKPVSEDYVQENWRHHEVMFELIADLARRAAPERTPRVLEVGMGLGTMSIALSRRNYEVVAIDSDPVQVARARNFSRTLGGFARYLCMEIADLKLFAADTFDVAFSQGTLEHFDPSGLREAICQQLRVAPFVVLSVPSVDWPDREIGGERRLTTDEWRVTLESLGHDIIALRYYGRARWHVLAAVQRRGYEPPGGRPALSAGPAEAGA
jgi:SAM-dependent methyltransferase